MLKQNQTAVSLDPSMCRSERSGNKLVVVDAVTRALSRDKGMVEDHGAPEAGLLLKV